MKSIRRVSCILVLLAASACVGPQTKNKSLAESLNGRNYETDPVTGSPPVQLLNPISIPVAVRRRALTQVEGRAVLEGPALASPLSGVEVVLRQKDAVVSRARTDAGGKFRFAADLEDGEAWLETESRGRKGSVKFEIRGFEIRDLVLPVK